MAEGQRSRFIPQGGVVTVGRETQGSDKVQTLSLPNTRAILQIDFFRCLADNGLRDFRERNNANERCLLGCLFLGFLLWHRRELYSIPCRNAETSVTNEHLQAVEQSHAFHDALAAFLRSLFCMPEHLLKFTVEFVNALLLAFELQIESARLFHVILRE